MAKVSTRYVCSNCKAHSPVHMGKCPRCGTWGSMEADVSALSAGPAVKKPRAADKAEVRSLADIAELDFARWNTGIEEVDRVLGGGWVAGSVILIAGEPGIGKSTLLLQLADAALEKDRTVLYVAGEESPAQVNMRAKRLGVSAKLELTRETDAAVLTGHLHAAAPDLVIVDSIQTLLASEDGTPGSLSQVRDATALLSRAAKEAGCTLVLIGHVTKQGNIAGPKVIEHMVDATVSLETATGFRVLRAIKNRFGPSGEMGVFEMTGEGMNALKNPSEAFLAERPEGVAGSIIVAALEGQRPLLLEVQGLAAKSPYASPRRIVQGLDQRRVDVALAVLERRVELPLAGLDVYVNVAGGLRLTDPGTDLAVALAVYSAVTNRPLPAGTAVVGEVGLAGELRSVAQLEKRISEAKRAGFERVIGPQSGNHDGIAVKSLGAAIRVAWEV